MQCNVTTVKEIKLILNMLKKHNNHKQLYTRVEVASDATWVNIFFGMY